jgi:acetylornithine deacetylase/succinyl-diaminopimelate desuccinylase-like protein
VALRHGRPLTTQRGCAVALEAVRIIQALGLKPRRTIRIALWSGEEQGLLGSRAYVAEHFGTLQNPGNFVCALNGERETMEWAVEKR